MATYTIPEITMTTEDRNKMVNAMADVVKAKNIKIEELQSALRACLNILYVVETDCEAERLGAIEQAHAVL